MITPNAPILAAMIVGCFIAFFGLVFHRLTVAEVEELLEPLRAPADTDAEDLIALEFDAVRAELAALREALPKKRKSRKQPTATEQA